MTTNNIVNLNCDSGSSGVSCVNNMPCIKVTTCYSSLCNPPASTTVYSTTATTKATTKELFTTSHSVGTEIINNIRQSTAANMAASNYFSQSLQYVIILIEIILYN